MTALLHSGDYMILIVKNVYKYILYKKYDHKIINGFNYILSIQRIVVTHNTAH
jgi:hypothetical protein